MQTKEPDRSIPMPPHSFRQGMTLLELIIATSILAIVMGAVFTALYHMSRDMSNEVSSTALNQESARTIERLMENLRSAHIDDAFPDAGGNAMNYFIPVDSDGDGDVLDGDLFIEWGQNGPAGVKPDCITQLRFTKVTSFDEKQRNYDLNGDGDKKDVFDIGRLEQAFYPTDKATGSPTSVKALTPDVIIQVAGKGVADINGDGVNDPLFLLDGNMLRIRMFVTRSDEATPRFGAFQTSVALRNW